MDNFPAYGVPIENTKEFLDKLAETVKWLYDTQSFDCTRNEDETFTVYPICVDVGGVDVDYKVYKAQGTKGNSGTIIINMKTQQMVYTPNKQRDDMPCVRFI